MRSLRSILLPIVACTALCVGSHAQSVSNLYTAGLSYNPGASSPIAGTAMYAHQVNDSGTFAFTMVDALPNTVKPFTISTNFGAGVAQRLASIAGVDVFVPTSAGIAYSGSNVGWQYSSGAAAVFKLKPYKNGYFYLMPTARFVKASVGSSGFQPIGGVLFGWGQ